ncbi:MAG: NUDIX hydrolase [Bdellovibrio sp.]
MKNNLLRIFNEFESVDVKSEGNRHACVSLILKGTDKGNLHLAFIQRAQNPQDRWSGHLAFPGGTKEDTDQNDLHAALRETEEEVGISLSADDLLGRLDDVYPVKPTATVGFYIRPFVFYIQKEFQLNLNPSEVADFFWVSLEEIQNPQRQIYYEYSHNFETLKLPAIDLDRDPPLWGLTYKMVQNLLAKFSSSLL